MRFPPRLQAFLIVGLLSIGVRMNAADVWDGPAFSVDPAVLRQAAQAVPAGKHSQATVLLNDLHFQFDENGRMTESRHLIYRIENQDGVKNWAETSGRWEAWHQDKPEIKARVITVEDTVHWLDSKTLNDIPLHEDAPDLYSDERKFGGPLPAVAPGSIVEEEVTVRDTAPLFAAGTTNRWIFGWNVPVNKTRVVLIHPVSLPLHYELHLLPEAAVRKATDGGVETITLEQGPLPAFTETINHAPADVVSYPEIEFATGTSWRQVASEYARLSNGKLRAQDVQTLVAQIQIKIKTKTETRNEAQRANDLTKDANFAILHTLACVDAQAGKTSQARDLLLKAMEAAHQEEPNPEVWFGFALIAEQYGVLDAAEKMYGRVEKPKANYPGTTYIIAQQHLDALHNAANVSAKAAGR